MQVLKLLKRETALNDVSIQLPSSKSISNRWLIIKALSDGKIELTNLSEAEDTQLLKHLLESNSREMNAGMAGTVYRFLTAYLSVIGKNVNLYGHARMHERPIEPLVNALNQLGANISYFEKEGFPPLSISPGNMRGGQIAIDSSVSSQFVSALLLISPKLKGGIELFLNGNVVSSPYIDMSIQVLWDAGINVSRAARRIRVEEGEFKTNEEIEMESDWSSAAFFYGYFALSNLERLFFKGLKLDSIQGDCHCHELFEMIGVETKSVSGGLELRKKPFAKKQLTVDLIDFPDLILPFALASVLIMDEVVIKGISTLFDKESNRVEALAHGLSQLNIHLEHDTKKMRLKKEDALPQSIVIETHNDHRIAMTFAMLSACMATVQIAQPDVVSKSFPGFWTEISKLSLIS